MTYLIRVGWSHVAVEMGDHVETGDYLGRNPRTLAPVYSPDCGTVSDILPNRHRYTLIIVIESHVFCPDENHRPAMPLAGALTA